MLSLFWHLISLSLLVIRGNIMTKKEFENEIQQIKEINKQKEYKQKIKNEKYKYRQKFETSKLLAIYLFLILNVIIIFSMIAMWHFKDLTYLGVLITDIAAQILIYGIYCLKAYKGKQSEENMKFERDKLSNDISGILLSGAKCTDTVPIIVEQAETIECKHLYDDADYENSEIYDE